MKKTLPVIILLLLSLTASDAAAAELEQPGTPLRKLQRGVINIVLSPVELAHELHKEKKKDEFIPSWVAGTGRGLFYTVGRALSGVYDLVTFPFPVPEHYEGLAEPEFAWDLLDEESPQ